MVTSMDIARGIYVAKGDPLTSAQVVEILKDAAITAEDVAAVVTDVLAGAADPAALPTLVPRAASRLLKAYNAVADAVDVLTGKHTLPQVPTAVPGSDPPSPAFALPIPTPPGTPPGPGIGVGFSFRNCSTGEPADSTTPLDMICLNYQPFPGGSTVQFPPIISQQVVHTVTQQGKSIAQAAGNDIVNGLKAAFKDLFG